MAGGDPAFRDRELLELIKRSTTKDDEYSDVMSFPSVDAMLSLKNPFKFTIPQISAMDVAGEEGRK